MRCAKCLERAGHCVVKTPTTVGTQFEVRLFTPTCSVVAAGKTGMVLV